MSATLNLSSSAHNVVESSSTRGSFGGIWRLSTDSITWTNTDTSKCWPVIIAINIFSITIVNWLRDIWRESACTYGFCSLLGCGRLSDRMKWKWQLCFAFFRLFVPGPALEVWKLSAALQVQAYSHQTPQVWMQRCAAIRVSSLWPPIRSQTWLANPPCDVTPFCWLLVRSRTLVV